MLELDGKVVVLAKDSVGVLRQVGGVFADKRAANAWLEDSGVVGDPGYGDGFAFARVVDVVEVEVKRVLKRKLRTSSESVEAPAVADVNGAPVLQAGE